MILETQTNEVLRKMFQVQAIGIGIVDDIGAQQDARRIRHGSTAEIETKDLYSGLLKIRTRMCKIFWKSPVFRKGKSPDF